MSRNKKEATPKEKHHSPSDSSDSALAVSGGMTGEVRASEAAGGVVCEPAALASYEQQRNVAFH